MSSSDRRSTVVRARPRGGHPAPRLGPLLSNDQRDALVAAAEARGYADGLLRGEAELRAALATVAAIPQAYDEALPAGRRELAAALTELSLAIAARVIGEALASDPAGAMRQAIEEALAAADVRGKVTIAVAPSAAEPLRKAWQAHSTAVEGEWSFVADPTLPDGGCVVRFASGLVDASLDAQLTAVAAALRTGGGER